jgi:4-hydroxy-tetrahydrodipicolinate synthase
VIHPIAELDPMPVPAPSPSAPGLVHTPVTPFSRDGAIDLDSYARLIEFHIGNGADSLALPMHAGESVSLPDGERRGLLAFAIKCVNGRKPVIAHVSETGTGVAAALARHAEEAGATAVIATTPYYWTPPPAMVLEHFAQIGAAVRIPFFVTTRPGAGHRVNTELCLADRFPASWRGSTQLDWQFMIDLMTRCATIIRVSTATGTELMVSAGAIGATGIFAPLAGIAPRLARVCDLCRQDRLSRRARREADRGAAQAVAGWRGKPPTAMRAAGRDYGEYGGIALTPSPSTRWRARCDQPRAYARLVSVTIEAAVRDQRLAGDRRALGACEMHTAAATSSAWSFATANPRAHRIHRAGSVVRTARARRGIQPSG